MTDPRAALEAIGQLPDIEIDIADAALQLARVDAPDADWEAARAASVEACPRRGGAGRRHSPPTTWKSGQRCWPG